MANLSKQKRARMIEFLKQLREILVADTSLIAINEIENEVIEKKYGLVWEQHEEQVDIEMKTQVPVFIENIERSLTLDSQKPYNFIIEGDNLHSLKLLAKTHKERIDVIYIDPPYNTGAKDWKYNNDYVDKNDGFRHSKWLSMMHSRLEVAKTLLTSEGALICAIDENELATTLLLIDDVFGENYVSNCITVIHNPRGVQGNNFSYVHEYAIFVYKKGIQVIGDKEIVLEDIEYSNLRNWGDESERTDAKNCFYPIFVKDGKIVGFGPVTPDDIHPLQNEYDEKSQVYAVYPIDIQGIERKWRYARQSVESIKDLLRVKNTKERYEIEIGKDFGKYKTVWTDKKYDANENGTQLVNSMVPTNDFDFPKSLWNVYDCLFAVIKDKPDAVVLDYFAGSGTTGHAIIMMNKILGGNRKFILCTNNAIGEKREKEFAQKYGEIADNAEQWEKYQEHYGIARSVTYPRIKAAAHGYVHKKDTKITLWEKTLTMKDLKNAQKLITELENLKNINAPNYDIIKEEIDDGVLKLLGIKKKGEQIDGIPTNIKYYKTGFVPMMSQDEDYELEIALLDHIVEMIQLEWAVQIDGEKHVLILNDDEIDAFMTNAARIAKCQEIYIASSVLLTSEQKDKLNAGKVAVNIIPDYYFEYELKEIGAR